MTDRSLLRPTEAELEILQVLWELGAVTVRDVHKRLAEVKGVRYTTTLKQLQVMTEKGLVLRDESQRSHVYRAAIPEEETQAQLLDYLLHGAFGGSAKKLFMQALSTSKASEAELDQIRQMLDRKWSGS